MGLTHVKATQNEIARNLSQQIAERIHKTTELQISANIKIIDNLWGFDMLTELKLDNNCIERIENIGHLTGLTSLDLSFNAIEVLEGLQPGDQVVLSDMSQWDAFDRVRLN